jgi:starch-binding outer membrane protein, SusD/RagB family
LTWAIQNGGLSKVPFPLNGFRITRGAAETLLAEVYLQRAGFPLQIADSYALAAQTARALIQSGEYQLISHGPTLEQSAYNIIRTSDVQREFIFTIEANDLMAPNEWPRMSFPPGIQFPGLAYPGNIGPGYQPAPKFLLIYDKEKDLRIQNQQFFYSSIELGGKVIKWEEPVPWLWFDKKATFETARGGQDIKLMRYPLVLLIAAESIARSEGVTAEAVKYLADVRSRAYWQTDRAEIVNALSGLSQEAFVEEVWKERLREMALDYKAWDDIRRTRKYPVTSAANPGQATFVNVIGANNGWGHTFKEHHLIYPIPLEEMQRNRELTQNPGY